MKNSNLLKLKSIIYALIIITCLLVTFKLYIKNTTKNNHKIINTNAKIYNENNSNLKDKIIFRKSFVKSIKIKGGFYGIFDIKTGSLESWYPAGYQKKINLAPNIALTVKNDKTDIFGAQYNLKQFKNNEIIFEKKDKDITTLKSFRLLNSPFAIRQEFELHNNSAEQKNLYLDLNITTKTLKSLEHAQVSTVYNINKKYYRDRLDKKNKYSKVFNGTINYIGLDKQYFLLTFSPENSKELQNAEIIANQTNNNRNNNNIEIIFHYKPIVIKPGQKKKISFISYLGPKQTKLLNLNSNNIQENIEASWLDMLSYPLSWSLLYTYRWVKNFGIAIILLTIFIKLITFPLTQKSFITQQQMKEISPELKEIQSQYKNDRITLAQKQLDLYRGKNIKPMSGCLPMLIQMPIWFALYRMLGNTNELYDQPFIWWIIDLTKPDPYFIFPLLMGLSMLLNQWIIPPQTDESQPQMKYFIWGMPIFLTFVMSNLSVGLSLYMLANNLLTMIQQIQVKKDKKK